MNARIKKVIAILLTVIMVLAMAIQSFAAPLSYARPAATGTEPAKITGTWSKDAAGNWHFNSQSGAAKGGWYYLNITNKSTEYNWFCFDTNGVMRTGWVQDKKDLSVWYYTGEIKDSSEGGLVKGWATDPHDGKKYYLDPSTGIMCYGWKQINGVWYYFGEKQYANASHPYGAMYVNEKTPDGYYVGSSGAWQQNTSSGGSSRKPTPVTKKTVADVLPDDFPHMQNDEDNPADDCWEAIEEEKEKQCYLTYKGDSLRFKYIDNYKDISTSATVSQVGDNYEYTDSSVKITFTMHERVLNSIKFADEATDIWDGTYQASACIAAGTMISMPEGKQKAVEELEIGDVICSFDHKNGEVSSAPVAFIWESKNAGNAFTLRFEDDVEVTVIEEHGFYDQEEQQYAFINLQNAEEYIGHHFYNADSNSWLELKDCEALNDRVDAYAIITSGDLNHMSNGMLSMCDGTVKMLANLFEYDDQMKFDEDEMRADIETYGLTPKEKILELDGFIESDYDTYNLQYIDIAIGKGLITWEWMEAISDYCVANGLVYSELINETPMVETGEDEPIIVKPATESELGEAEKVEPEEYEETKETVEESKETEDSEIPYLFNKEEDVEIENNLSD